MNLFSRIKSAFSTGGEKRAGVFATFLTEFFSSGRFDPKAYYTSWAFAAINAIAEQTSTIDIKMQKKNSNGEWEDLNLQKALDIEKNPIRLLHKVNSEMTSSQLFYSVPSWVESEGNAFWMVVYNGKAEPVELWPIDSTKVIVSTDKLGFVNGYKIKNDAGSYTWLEINEIIPFKRYNIRDRNRGMSTIEAVKNEIETDVNAGAYSKNFYKNSAIPAGSLETDKSLTTDQVAEIKNQWNAKYQGVENAGKIALLHSGLKFSSSSISQRDMQYLEQRKYSRDSIIAIFRVPPVILGILENANRANIEGAEYIFAKYRIKPYMELIVDHLNEFYLQMWKLSQDKYRFALATDPVPANEELLLKKRQTSYGKWQTANEIREELGLEPRQDGDVLADPSGGFLDEPLDSDKPEEDKKGKKKLFLKAKVDPIVAGLQKVLAKNTKKSTKKYQKLLDDTQADLLIKLDKNKKVLTSPINQKQPSDIAESILYFAKLRVTRKEKSEELVRLLFEDWDKWIGILYDSLKDDYEISLAYGGAVGLQRVDVAIKFDLSNEKAQAWIEDTALKNAKSIIGSLKDDLRPVIVDAAKAGEGAQVVADALALHYSELEDWKALQLARTELANGYSQGNLEGYRQSKVVDGKEWFAGGDGQDDGCAKNDGKIVGLDDVFPSGDDCPTVHPNCECTVLPVVKKD